MSEGTTSMHVGNASASTSSHVANQDERELINFLQPASAGQNASFFDVVQPSRSVNDLPVAYMPDQENELPSRLLKAIFYPRYRVPANEVFDALKDTGVNSSVISCIQCQSSGEIVIMFRCAQLKRPSSRKMLKANNFTFQMSSAHFL